MTAAETTQLAIQLLNERSRESLIQELGAVMEKMGPEASIAFLADLLLTLGADRDQLKARLTSILASQFGRRSEKSSREQLELFAKALRIVDGEKATSSSEAPKVSSPESEPAPTAAELIAKTNAEIRAEIEERREKRKAEREARRADQRAEKKAGEVATPWPPNLPVREETLEVPEADKVCGDCGKERSVIGYEKSWRIEYTTQAEVVVTKIPVVACASHHGKPVSAPVPPKPVDGGTMGFSLAAHALWLRATHNLPVRRIAEMMQAEGVPVTEPMLHTLICETGKRVEPVVEAIRSAVRASALVNLDDTHIDVHEGKGKRRRRRARVWLALGDEKYAYFFATRTWKREEAEEALGSLTGVLQGDGYKGFPAFAEDNDLELAGCMAHFRRKIRKAFLANDPRAIEAMALVQGLYRVEELARLRKLDVTARLALRQERSVPIMNALIAWAKAVEPTIEKNSPLGQAWTYLSNQLEPLQVFLSNGIVPIDNSSVERGLRRITIGRKLWLFFRDQTKLEYVSGIMSVVTTARLFGVDERAYLTWLLEQLARREWSATAARALLPEAWLALQKQKTEKIGTDKA